MATSQVETVSTGADKAKLGAAVALVVAALVAYYFLASRGSLAQWSALLVCLAGAVAVFFTSETGRQLVAFGRDAWREVKKVVMALFLWVTDKTLEWVFYGLILGWR